MAATIKAKKQAEIVRSSRLVVGSLREAEL